MSVDAARIDVVIPSHPKDFDVLAHSVRGALRYINPLRRVWVVSSEPFESRDRRVVWVPEDTGGAGLPTIADVAARWSLQGSAPENRAGWLYQQILKLGAPDLIRDLSDVYMVLDADVVWLREQHVAINEAVRFPYTKAVENHLPYRAAYQHLFGRVPGNPFSLTAHQMVYDQKLLREMKAEIASRHGVDWWDAYVDAANPLESSAISEFDIYGHWVLDTHPEVALRHELTYLNVAVVPGPVGRAAYARDFDFVAAHAWMRAPRWVRAAQIVAGVKRDLVSAAKQRARAMVRQASE